MYYPQTAFIVLSTGCNRRLVCGHCFYNVQPERIIENELETAEIIDVLKKLRLCGVSAVILTGGEPLMREDLSAIAGAASKLGMSVVLLTNGTLLDEEKLNRLIRAGVDSIVMSLVKLDEPERHGAALLAGAARLPFSFIFCFTKANYNLIPAVEWFADECGARTIFQPAFIPAGHEAEEYLSPRHIDPFEWTRLYMTLKPWARTAGLRNYLDLVHGLYTGDAVRPKKCLISGNALVVDADGMMYPCFHRRDLCCGKATGNDFSDALAALRNAYPKTASAECFGEHCVSLFTGL